VDHPQRGQILAELHARPFRPLIGPARVLRFAFTTEVEAMAADRLALVRFCEKRGVTPPQGATKHHAVSLAGATLRWEQHTEFTTYTWIFERSDPSPFRQPARLLASAMHELPQPGPLLAATDLALVGPDDLDGKDGLFDAASLATSRAGAEAEIATDFKSGPDGFVRILVVDRGLSPAAAGALTQRLLEVDTYRCFSLLGLVEARRIAAPVRRIEQELDDLTSAMIVPAGPDGDRVLLDRLMSLAAQAESLLASTDYRFGASRAYHQIVEQRLAVIRETPIGGAPTLAEFLNRRLAPAMRTCVMTATRQADLAAKLARTAQLLRTRVDIAMEKQNSELLTKMNERAHVQLRLQQTVEGLSVAAISYYVLNLIHYALEGAAALGLRIEPTIGVAVSLPPVVLAVAYGVRRIRRAHGGGPSNKR
jgi:uncharacterized membrane-anchored protein